MASLGVVASRTQLCTAGGQCTLAYDRCVGLGELGSLCPGWRSPHWTRVLFFRAFGRGVIVKDVFLWRLLVGPLGVVASRTQLCTAGGQCTLAFDRCVGLGELGSLCPGSGSLHWTRQKIHMCSLCKGIPSFMFRGVSHVLPQIAPSIALI